MGCIVAEVLAYILNGAEGIIAFERGRAFRDGAFTRYRFHRGGAEEPVVTAWLQVVGQSTSRPIRMLGILVGEMLSIQPQERPCAQDVEVKMSFISILAMC